MHFPLSRVPTMRPPLPLPPTRSRPFLPTRRPPTSACVFISRCRLVSRSCTYSYTRHKHTFMYVGIVRTRVSIIICCVCVCARTDLSAGCTDCTAQRDAATEIYIKYTVRSHRPRPNSSLCRTKFAGKKENKTYQ